MDLTLRVSGRAEKSLRNLPRNDLRRIMAALAAMRTDPLRGDVAKLKGTHALRRRVGDYRIIFTIDFDRGAIDILDVLRRTTTTYR